MKIKGFEDLNNERFLNEAFETEHNQKLGRAARARRNIYLGLFVVGFVCIFVAALAGWLVLSILSLFLATLSLVVMTKYDTQLFFLRIIRLRGAKEEEPPEY